MKAKVQEKKNGVYTTKYVYLPAELCERLNISKGDTLIIDDKKNSFFITKEDNNE